MPTYFDIISTITYDTKGEDNISGVSDALKSQLKTIDDLVAKQKTLKAAIENASKAAIEGDREAIRLKKSLSKELEDVEVKLKKANTEAAIQLNTIKELEAAQKDLKAAIENATKAEIEGDKEAIRLKKSLSKELEGVEAKLKKANAEVTIQRNAIKDLEAAQKTLKAAIENATKAAIKGDKEAIAVKKQLSKELEQVEAKLKNANIQANNIKKAGEQLRSFGSEALGALGFAGIAASAVAAGAAVIGLTAQFEGYEAQLKTALGSTEAAEAALDAISKAAAQTPESVQSLTEAYARLSSSGLQPTIKELLKLTDVAVSQNKAVTDYVEAIIDAQTGEFERLKEFGIRASKEGDKITFTFKEQKTVVQATDTAIRDYLIGLGEVEGVAGAAAEKSKTLGGALSNLGDSLSRLAVSIGEKASPALSSFIGLITRGVNAITQLNETGDKVKGALGETGLTLFDFKGFETVKVMSVLKEAEKIASSDNGITDAFEANTQRINAIRALQAEVLKSTELNDNQKKLTAQLLKGEIDTLLRQQTTEVNNQLKRQELDRTAAAEKAAAERKKQADEAAKEAKKEAERIAKIRKDAAKDLASDISDIEREITELGIDAKTFEGIKQKGALEREAAIERIENRRQELKEQGALNAELDKSLNTIIDLTNRKFDIKIQTDIDDLNAKLAEFKSNLADFISERKATADTNAIEAALDAEGNVFNRYLLTLQLANQRGKEAANEIAETYQGRIKEVEDSQLKSIEKTNAIQQLKASRDLELANAEADLLKNRADAYEAYLDELIKYDISFGADRQAELKQGFEAAETILNESYQKGLLGKKQYEKAQTDIQKEYERERLELLIKSLEQQQNALNNLLPSAGNKQQQDSIKKAIADITAQISTAKLELSEANLPDSDGGDNKGGGFLANLLGVTDKQVSDTLNLANSVKQQAISLIESINKAQIEQTDRLIAEQQKRLEAVRGGNAEQVKLEEARLNELQKRREAYVQRQRELNAVLAISNFAAATAESVKGIAAAAAEGGVLAPITIGLYLASIGLGIASLTNMLKEAQNGIQGFYEGGVNITPETVRGRKRKIDPRDTIPALLAPGESVMTVQATRQYAGELEAMNAGYYKTPQLDNVAGVPIGSLRLDTMQLASNIRPAAGGENSTYKELRQEIAGMKSVLADLTEVLRGARLGRNGNVILDGEKVGHVLQAAKDKQERTLILRK